jgi:hypothetical protein
MTIDKKNLYVSTDGTAGPYIMMPVECVDLAREILDDLHVPYYVDRNAVRANGIPVFTVVNISSDCTEEQIATINEALKSYTESL